MTLPTNDLRLAIRGLFRSPLFSILALLSTPPPAARSRATPGLSRSPLFTTVAILSLALGIGANSAIFTLIDQILLRKLPVRAPEELVMLYQRGSHNGSNMGSRMNSYPIYMDYMQKGAPLSQVICRRLAAASVSIDNRTERLDAELVSGNYFTMLGVAPGAGRVLQPKGGD